MSLQSITKQFTKGGTGLTDGTLEGAVRELQGLTVSHITGAAANTKMDIAAMRKEDTILSALVFIDAGGSVVDDAANITIQETHAQGTITVSGNPVADETFVVNGSTYTFKAVATALGHVKITAGDNNAMAAAIAAAINAVENRILPQFGAVTGRNEAQVVATVATNVVTITSVADGPGNGAVITGTVTVLAAAGSGTAAATLTPVTVVADNTCIVNGVTFTAKVAPTGEVQFYTKAAAPAYPGVAGATAGSDCATGHWLAKKINAYQSAHGNLDVVATAHATTGVVTLAPKTAFKGNIITLTEGATNVAVSGATLAGGTNTGGIKSSSTNSSKKLTVIWFNKR